MSSTRTRGVSNKLTEVTFNNVAEMLATPGAKYADKCVATLLGYYAPGDGGGGEFYYDAASSATANGGTVFAATGGGRWLLNIGDSLDVRQCGAVPYTGLFVLEKASEAWVDATAALTRAFALGIKHGVEVILPPLTFIVDNPIYIYGGMLAYPPEKIRGTLQLTCSKTLGRREAGIFSSINFPDNRAIFELTCNRNTDPAYDASIPSLSDVVTTTGQAFSSLLYIFSGITADAVSAYYGPYIDDYQGILLSEANRRSYGMVLESGGASTFRNCQFQGLSMGGLITSTYGTLFQQVNFTCSPMGRFYNGITRRNSIGLGIEISDYKTHLGATIRKFSSVANQCNANVFTSCAFNLAFTGIKSENTTTGLQFINCDSSICATYIDLDGAQGYTIDTLYSEGATVVDTGDLKVYPVIKLEGVGRLDLRGWQQLAQHQGVREASTGAPIGGVPAGAKNYPVEIISIARCSLHIPYGGSVAPDALIYFNFDGTNACVNNEEITVTGLGGTSELFAFSENLEGNTKKEAVIQRIRVTRKEASNSLDSHPYYDPDNKIIHDTSGFLRTRLVSEESFSNTFFSNYRFFGYKNYPVAAGSSTNTLSVLKVRKKKDDLDPATRGSGLLINVSGYLLCSVGNTAQANQRFVGYNKNLHIFHQGGVPALMQHTLNESGFDDVSLDFAIKSGGTGTLFEVEVTIATTNALMFVQTWSALSINSTVHSCFGDMASGQFAGYNFPWIVESLLSQKFNG